MRFRRACCGAGTGRPLDGSHLQALALHQLANARHNKEVRAHILRLFLNPDDLARVGMFVNRGGDLRTRRGITLVEKYNRGGGVFATTAVGAELVAEFAADDEDALSVLYFAVGNDG